MYFNEDLVKKLEKGVCIFRNFTDDHEFIVGDKISYQVGDYKNPRKKYRIQGFVLALGYNKKNEPMYLIGNTNVVIYDTNKNVYISDKRSMFKWYSEKELHVLPNEKADIKAKLIGYKSHDTVTRIIEGKSIHIINLQRTTRYTKLSKYIAEASFNINRVELSYYKFKIRATSDKTSIYDGVCAYYAPDQTAAKAMYDANDRTVCRVETTRHKWDENNKKYVSHKPMYKYYIIVQMGAH